MKTLEHIRDYINSVASWASAQPDIRAVALVGSYARNAATETSDIDLVILTNEPARYLENTGWVQQFGHVAKQQTELYGPVTSLRIWYAGGPEVEYGITTPDWAAQPLDEGTRRVIQDGMIVLYEREALLSPCLNDE
jgi:predicted nucleotidyltransferase